MVSSRYYHYFTFNRPASTRRGTHRHVISYDRSTHIWVRKDLKKNHFDAHAPHIVCINNLLGWHFGLAGYLQSTGVDRLPETEHCRRSGAGKGAGQREDGAESETVKTHSRAVCSTCLPLFESQGNCVYKYRH